MEPTKRVKTNPNALESLKNYTKVVADSGEFSQIKQYSPEDATTNPSLILAAAKQEEYRAIFDQAVQDGVKETGKAVSELSEDEKKTLVASIIDLCAVNFGLEILKLVPGVVSTEVDARLSFDTDATVERARKIIKMYESRGIQKEKVLIKIASTWEGIQAAKILKQEGIQCNMTLIFGYGQAIACGQADVRLISPFVGRIYDWYKKQDPSRDVTGANCPGVQSVTQIYQYFKKYNINTIVMGASFRNTSQILELSGCDKLTISPKLLKQLQEDEATNVEQKLNEEKSKSLDIPEINVDEKTFRWMQNEDACMSELLPAGIRSFSRDIEKLEVLIQEALQKL